MRSFNFLTPALAAVLGTTSCLAAATPPDMTMEPAQFFKEQHSKRVKIRYGPFTVDSMDVNNGMADFVRETVQMPCTDCLITWMQAGLEYQNGTVANADTNFWLHHTVFANQNRTSAVCPLPDYPDTFFASGNERTPINICVNGTDQAGYYVAPTDTLGMEAELMNMAMSSQTGWVTITYEYIPHPPPTFSQVKVLWLDIGGCLGGSDQPVKSTTQPFEYTSPKWVSDISGRITFIGAHLHDGGTHLEILRNGTDECNAIATYGANPAYYGGGMSMSMSMGSSSMSMSKRSPATSATMTMSMPASASSMDMSSMTMSMPSPSASAMLMDNVHISNISVCANPKNALISPGDIWTINAYYDPSQHDLMMDTNGTATPIMGIALVYVAELNMTSAAGASTATGTGAAASTSSGSSSGAGKSIGLGMETVALMMALGLVLVAMCL